MLLSQFMTVPTGCVGKLFKKALSKNEYDEEYKARLACE